MTVLYTRQLVVPAPQSPNTFLSLEDCSVALYLSSHTPGSVLVLRSSKRAAMKIDLMRVAVLFAQDCCDTQVLSLIHI